MFDVVVVSFMVEGKVKDICLVGNYVDLYVR